MTPPPASPEENVSGISTVCRSCGGADHAVYLSGVDEALTVDSIGQSRVLHRP